MPYSKSTGKKVPYTKKNMANAKAGKAGLTYSKPKKVVKKVTIRKKK